LPSFKSSSRPTTKLFHHQTFVLSVSIQLTIETYHITPYCAYQSHSIAISTTIRSLLIVSAAQHTITHTVPVALGTFIRSRCILTPNLLAGWKASSIRNLGNCPCQVCYLFPSCHLRSADIVPATSRTISPFPLLNLPPDLVLCVFDVLAKEGDWCVLTCLGLSCRYLYRTLKDRYYPTPISLDHGFWRTLRSPVKDSDGSTSKYRKINEYFPLVVLVTEFIGPKYRLLSGESPPVFVLKKVYGECDDCGNKREGALRGRRRDFRRMTYYRDGKVSSNVPDRVCTFQLTLCRTIGYTSLAESIQRGR
jgi:hypothetical protein